MDEVTPLMMRRALVSSDESHVIYRDTGLGRGMMVQTFNIFGLSGSKVSFGEIQPLTRQGRSAGGTMIDVLRFVRTVETNASRARPGLRRMVLVLGSYFRHSMLHHVHMTAEPSTSSVQPVRLQVSFALFEYPSCEARWLSRVPAHQMGQQPFYSSHSQMLVWPSGALFCKSPCRPVKMGKSKPSPEAPHTWSGPDDGTNADTL